MRSVIPLTDAQRSALHPFFNLVAKYNADGVPCAIGAQCFRDGLSVKLFHGDEAVTLADAIGGDMRDTVKTAEQSAREGTKRDMNRKNIEQLAIVDIKTWAEKQGLVISDEDAKSALDRIAKRIEEEILNGSSTERPRGLLPSNALAQGPGGSSPGPAGAMG